MHGKKYAAVHWFEAITDVRECTLDNDRHRIVKIRFLHLFRDTCLLEFADFHKGLIGETFFFEAFNTFTDNLFCFFYVSPSYHLGCSWFFEVLVMSKMKIYFLLPAFTEIVKRCNI